MYDAILTLQLKKFKVKGSISIKMEVLPFLRGKESLNVKKTNDNRRTV